MFLALDPRRLPAFSSGAPRFDTEHRYPSQKAKSRYSCQRPAGPFYSGEFADPEGISLAPARYSAGRHRAEDRSVAAHALDPDRAGDGAAGRGDHPPPLVARGGGGGSPPAY